MSINGLLEEECLKTNSLCTGIRDHIKKETKRLKDEDDRLQQDDTVLLRMINFFNEYKKRYEEWMRKRKGRSEAVSASQEKATFMDQHKGLNGNSNYNTDISKEEGKLCFCTKQALLEDA